MDPIHLIIDGQVFQTSSSHRGMGKYSLSLIQILQQNSLLQPYTSVTLVLNKNLSIDKNLLEEISQKCAPIQWLFVDLKIPSGDTAVKSLQVLNRNSLTKAIQQHGREGKIDFLILSLFLGETCAVFPEVSRKLLLFYDLIPLLYPDRYKKRINYADYLQHFSSIFESDVIFTISQTVADDLKIYLGIMEKKIINIDGASIDRSNLNGKKPKVNIPSKFILMPSGDELRKNNVRAVNGFELFNASHHNKYQLVITSQFNDSTQQELALLSKNIIFTGNVSEEEIQWLYVHAQLVLFASEYEGLGLPVLEGISVGQKIACSSIPVFKEISDKAFYFFDHFHPSSIAVTIDHALQDKDWDLKKREYAEILNRYSWKQTSEKFVKGLDGCKTREEKKEKPRVAVFTPHPGGFSAVGKVVAESHDSLKEYFDIDYFIDRSSQHKLMRPYYLSAVANCFEASEFNVEKYASYDATLYHIGNNEYHLETIKNALYLPGYVIIHDTFLEDVFNVLERKGYISMKRFELEKRMDGFLDVQNSSCLTSLVNNQMGIVVHSRYAANAVRSLLEKPVPVVEINLPVSAPLLEQKKSSVPFHIGLAGIISDNKGLRIIEEIVATKKMKESLITVFGFDFLKSEISERLKKQPGITVIANPSDFEFQSRLSKLDVLINYRLAYKGETSLSTLEAMRYGVPVIVRGDMGWYAELPDETVIKVYNEMEIPETLKRLFEDRSQLDKIGNSAKLFVQNNFSSGNYASMLSEMIGRSKTRHDSL
ncbi:MAG TPA: glycosyltransferase [Cytophagaceae bacterium]|nr:glycosyltransferase [Cytophagaceae bacterium]